MSRVTSKGEMYALWQAGRFGNRPAAWGSVKEFQQSGWTGPVVLRYAGQGGEAWCEYDVKAENVDAVVAKWTSEGADPSKIKVNEFVPDDQIAFQGEVRRSPGYLDLRYSVEKLPMRKALARKQVHVDGVRATETLKHFLDPASYDDLIALLDDFDDAVIELSSWSCDVGLMPRRNTIFWEVRHY